MKIIGETVLKINGEAVSAKVASDGCVILPDGTRKELPKEQFQELRKRLKMEEADMRAAERAAKKKEWAKKLPQTLTYISMGLSVLTIIALFVGFSVLPKLIAQPLQEIQESLNAAANDPSGSDYSPSAPTQRELDEAQTIIVFARIITPEGKEKEVVLGYFTTDDEESDLPDVGEGEAESAEAPGTSEGDPMGENESEATGGFAGEEKGGIIQLQTTPETGKE